MKNALASFLMLVSSVECLADTHAQLFDEFWSHPKLPEFGHEAPGTICVAIDEAVEKPGLYWIPNNTTLEGFLNAPPVKAKKNFDGSVGLWRGDLVIYFIKLDGKWTGRKQWFDRAPPPINPFNIPATDFQIKAHDIFLFQRILYN